MISQQVDMYGESAKAQGELFKYLLLEHGNCIGDGSNIGMHAVPVSIICSLGIVYCYELQRLIFHILCANIVLNKRLNSVAKHSAISKKQPCVEIETSSYDKSWNYGSSSIKSGISSKSRFDAKTGKDGIDVVNFDTDMNEHTKISLTKIDA